MAKLTPSEFAAKWKGNQRTERAAAQEHFIDLCRMLGVPTPNEADPKGEWYAFEKGAEKVEGGDGFADVWKRAHFAWEYKGKRKNLGAAYNQLLQYREALENPPILVVSDMDHFQVHTNFTGTLKQVHAFDLASLVKEPEEPLRVLRAVMSNPEALRPATTRNQLTEQAAAEFAALATALRGRGHDPHRVAHFLNKVLFCLFAEDAGLLPAGLMGRLAEGTGSDPAGFTEGLKALFGRMAKAGGLFGPERIEWFNGGLFDDDDVLPLTRDDIGTIRSVSRLDWSEIEPAIFGTLFERGMDPDSRTSLGAHYTDRESILLVVEPVVLAPLRREFDALKAATPTDLVRSALEGSRLAAGKKALAKARKAFTAFLDRLAGVRVLDPACGSGNFLYVALQGLKDLEREVLLWGGEVLRHDALPQVGPEAVLGIEINDYAAELARVTIWIGHIQWMLAHGFTNWRTPILQPLDTIACRDAILDRRHPGHPMEPDWPEAEFIVGNPPFLGTKKLRGGLGDDYVEDLFAVYGERIPNFSDLCCYWFEKARALIERGKCRRAGLLATQGIRGGENNRVLQRIKETGDIFAAIPDREWILEGANVHVSIVAFDDGSEDVRVLDGEAVAEITAELTPGVSLVKSRRLESNAGIGFIGDVKGGPFDIPGSLAREWLATPNPDRRRNSEVVRPWMNTLDVTRRPRDMWIVDFGEDRSLEDAALYEAPFRHVENHVKSARAAGRPTRKEWWLHMRPCPSMRAAVKGLPRFPVTPTLAKHRLVVWLDGSALPDHQLVVFGRDDDYFFGVLHSSVHERWALAKGTALEDRPRYTPTTCFETFPFPSAASGVEVAASGALAERIRSRVSAAAARLSALRDGWLNPPGAPDAGTRRRTLTNLYNERPAWLENVHLELDRAVLAAYEWPEAWAEGLQPARDPKGRANPALGVRDPVVEQEVLTRLLALNLEQAKREKAGKKRPDAGGRHTPRR